MFSDIYSRLLRSIIHHQSSGRLPPIEQGNSQESPKKRSSVSEFSALIRAGYRHKPNSNLGLVFGKHLMPVNACEFSRMLTSVTTVERFFTLLVAQYHRLGLKPYPIFFMDGQHACIALTYPYQPMTSKESSDFNKQRMLNRFCSESFYAYCVNVLRSLVDANISPTYMALDYADPGYGRDYQTFFNCAVEFDAGLSLIRFPKQLMHRPLASANLHLHDVYRERFSEHWHDARREQSFRYRAVTLMMLNAPHCFQIGELAKQMSISIRGLQKRLKNENSSFSELTQQVRRELLKICLVQSAKSLEDSAWLLGFQTSASFKRFFREQIELTDHTTVP